MSAQAGDPQPMASSLVNNKYRITRRIGGGSFGEIYMGIGPSNEKVCELAQQRGKFVTATDRSNC